MVWRVAYGGRHSHGGHGGIVGFFCVFSAVGVALTRPNPTQYCIAKAQWGKRTVQNTTARPRTQQRRPSTRRTDGGGDNDAIVCDGRQRGSVFFSFFVAGVFFMFDTPFIFGSELLFFSVHPFFFVQPFFYDIFVFDTPFSVFYACGMIFLLD